ncbi:hypothetical protein ACTQ34_18085, partial [Agathobaculum sp. LCP25S3_E8]|uniref:hypothetical protein n=1 Tax=Agathobaculum sp. LCP25S3_E8 TaxID=3438735 RepID=UPI003F93B55A
ISARLPCILHCISVPSSTPFLFFIIPPWVCGFIVSLQAEQEAALTGQRYSSKDVLAAMRDAIKEE